MVCTGTWSQSYINHSASVMYTNINKLIPWFQNMKISRLISRVYKYIYMTYIRTRQTQSTGRLSENLCHKAFNHSHNFFYFWHNIIKYNNIYQSKLLIIPWFRNMKVSTHLYPVTVYQVKTNSYTWKASQKWKFDWVVFTTSCM